MQEATPKLLVGASIPLRAWDERQEEFIQFEAGRGYPRRAFEMADPWRTASFFVFLDSLLPMVGETARRCLGVEIGLGGWVLP